jgi:hypothetical protein
MLQENFVTEKRKYLKFLADVHILSISEKVWCDVAMSSVCIFVRVTSALTSTRILLRFGIYAFICHRSLFDKYEIIWALHRSPQNQICDFIEGDSTDFDRIHKFLKFYLPK